jgi:hypothetical protein
VVVVVFLWWGFAVEEWLEHAENVDVVDHAAGVSVYLHPWTERANSRKQYVRLRWVCVCVQVWVLAVPP